MYENTAWLATCSVS